MKPHACSSSTPKAPPTRRAMPNWSASSRSQADQHSWGDGSGHLPDEPVERSPFSLKDVEIDIAFDPFDASPVVILPVDPVRMVRMDRQRPDPALAGGHDAAIGLQRLADRIDDRRLLERRLDR